MTRHQIRALFLDFDGVLNSLEGLAANKDREGAPTTEEERLTIAALRPHLTEPENEPSLRSDLRQLDPTLIARLNTITCEDVAVIVTSVWREGFTVRGLQILLESRGFVGRVIGKTQRVFGGNRGDEIQQWLDTHEADLALMGYTCPPFPGSVGAVAILDDDSDMGRWMPRLVRTDNKVGLQAEDVRRVKALLQEPIG